MPRHHTPANHVALNRIIVVASVTIRVVPAVSAMMAKPMASAVSVPSTSGRRANTAPPTCAAPRSRTGSASAWTSGAATPAAAASTAAHRRRAATAEPAATASASASATATAATSSANTATPSLGRGWGSDQGKGRHDGYDDECFPAHEFLPAEARRPMSARQKLNPHKPRR